ncbi:hypothetical protein BCR35DRAFT_305599 [Leucosporidium creatinivorum]|uniref:Uncharacterized protein n=1 Tax=Leucosporidium creatinivorum TaxID=106004 RepID=A0A1Y2F0H0_9BASI|nr:hypothetical protein BCR35DRAFT_305599 [Leucosporidium creatinivorum]
MSCCGNTHDIAVANSLFECADEVPREQKDEVQRVHDKVQDYLEAKWKADEAVQAEKALLSLQINPKYAFTRKSPTPLPPAHELLLSITYLYFTSTVSTLPSSALATLSSRLVEVPSFGRRESPFTGNEVTRPEDLDEERLESLMRVGGFLLVELVKGDELMMWRELGEAGSSLWEIPRV